MTDEERKKEYRKQKGRCWREYEDERHHFLPEEIAM